MIKQSLCRFQGELQGENPLVRLLWYPSKDGTKIPLFLVYRKGLKLDGNNATLLYGYGGFNIVVSPTFSAARIALLEQGFVYASVNMRGGSEYGEAWHDAGTKLKKQNVFDDFIAAAEYLVREGYASPRTLGMMGGSNGGKLARTAFHLFCGGLLLLPPRFHFFG